LSKLELACRKAMMSIIITFGRFYQAEEMFKHFSTLGQVANVHASEFIPMIEQFTDYTLEEAYDLVYKGKIKNL